MDKNSNFPKVKTIIAGAIIAFIGFGINQYIEWRKDKKIIEQCQKECCEYNSIDNLWVYTCDLSLCFCKLSLKEKISLPDCCMQFPTQKQCIDYCSNELRGIISSQIPNWLRWFY